MRSKLSIGQKIVFVTIPITMFAVLFTAVVSGISSRNALEEAAFERLTAVRELKAQQIEDYFLQVGHQVAQVALDQSNIDTLDAIGFTTYSLPSISEKTKSANLAAVSSFYSKNIFTSLKESRIPGLTQEMLSALVPQDPIALYFQNAILVSQSLETVDTLPTYWQYYLDKKTDLDAQFVEFSQRFGFPSVYFALEQDARVVYSTQRGMEIGTSLTKGPHHESNLAEAVKQALTLKKGEAVFVDFESYIPAMGRPTGFMASPIFKGDVKLGAVAFEIPITKMNDMMTSHQSWSEVGLGASGETYLVGDDFLLRSQSRFLIEDRDQYLQMIREIGTPEETVQLIASQNNSIGLQKVDTVGTRTALKGEIDTRIFPDYRGVDVLSSFRPLNIPDTSWVIMSEIDKAEALAAFQKLQDKLILIASVVLAATVFFGYFFSLSLSRPIRALAMSAKELTGGNLDAIVDVQTGDEIGELADEFQKMQLALRESFERVEIQKDELECEVKRQTEELRETSSQLNSALASMSSGIYMLDEELNFVLFNQRFLEQYEVPEGVVQVGTNIRDVLKFHAHRGDFGDRESEEVILSVIDEFRSKTNQRIERKLPNGKTINAQFSFLESGSVIVVTSDISDLKEKEDHLLHQNEEMLKVQGDLKDSEQRISKIIQSSPDGIITIDRSGIVQSFSNSAERIFGYFAEEVIGRNVKILMPKEVALEHDYYLERYTVGKSSSIVGGVRVVDALRKDGTKFKMELRVEAIEFEGAETLYIGTVRDITIQLQMEEEVNRAREEAIAANAAKSAFLANMSHELRTPMNAIIGYSEMLAEDAEDDGDEDVLADLNKITTAGKHLLSLINDVLDLSKIEAGKMELFIEEFSFSDLAAEVVVTAQSLADKNGNSLAVQIDENLNKVSGDLTKTRQMLFNLISNAAKFTTDGTITLIGESYQNRGEEWLRMTVADTGIGIPASKLDKIFQEFSQADESTTRNYGGTGLGLSLTRRFAEMMGGRIKVESIEGEGSQFIIELPMEVEKRHEGLEAEASIEDHDPITSPEEVVEQLAEVSEHDSLVLVIDDEQNARRLLQRALEQQGCKVILANDGREGLRQAAKYKPNLITLDVMMPGMDGWAVLRSLKSDEALRDIPVLMVSMIGDRGMSYELGAVDALQKPVDRNKLRKFVETYAHSKNKNVLIVEDDPAARSNLKSILEKEKWRVTEAENGAVGLEKAQSTEYQLILLDLMMPVMDGFEFLQSVRSPDCRSSRSPVVVITAKDLDATDRAKLSGSVDQVVAKSGQSIESIMAEVRSALGGQFNKDRGPNP
ncbi:PAS domain S-box-containing protein [Shimia gijangensis]|uniref:Sensor protein FixL n=1 Tax=Shimia gijangensis TaxID=1470563 RepID=A0A1M6ANY8_9RHOB|nr:response regulator [Shimia gijangensis]SHI38196.1 PAS domain S-box-containing protein [Shimia gijangensis]